MRHPQPAIRGAVWSDRPPRAPAAVARAAVARTWTAFLPPAMPAALAAFGCATCGGALAPAAQRRRCTRRRRPAPASMLSDTHDDSDDAGLGPPPVDAPAFAHPSIRRAQPPKAAAPPIPPPPPPLPPPDGLPPGMDGAAPLISSIALTLRGFDALPSEASLMRYMRDLRPKLDYLGPRARERVLSALEVANVAHDGQKRKSGEPFIIHPIAVAAILAELRMDRDSVIAGLLHDTVEDTPFTLEEVETLFGRDVRKIVEGETKISKLASKVHTNQNSMAADAADDPPKRFASLTRLQAPSFTASKKEEEQADNLRGMFLAMTEDVRVIIVKLADRLHNMRTLEHMKPEKQKKIAKETLEFFAPLAHRLGMRRIKTELEELSFRYLYPEDYSELVAEVKSIKRRTKFDYCLREAERTIKNVLEEDRVLYNMIRNVEVIGSTKELYNIHKRRLAGESLSSMLDVANIQVVVDLDPGVSSNHSCYHVLYRIHNMWKPLPKRFKDYIAFPKPNGYQSLHTTVLLGPKHDFFAMEIQIRTKAMHSVAEEGIAAELFQCTVPSPTVAASGAMSARDEDGKAPGWDAEWRKRTQGWLVSVRDYIDSFSSSRDLVDAVRRDLLGNRVFVFTPKGRIVDLPKDSTPVDLAYRIHTDVGHKMSGVRVNGRMVPLDYTLQNADVVKIFTAQSSQGPSTEWMGYAKSRTARQRIRQFLRTRDRDNMLGRGRMILERAATKQGAPLPSEAALTDVLPRLGAVLASVSRAREVTAMTSVDDLYMAIAQGAPEDALLCLEDTVLSLLRTRRHAVLDNAATSPETVDGLAAPPPQLETGTCCHPLRGDEVMGIRTTQEGHNAIVVHRLHCPHLLEKLRERPLSANLVGLRWVGDAERVDADAWANGHGLDKGLSLKERTLLTARVVVLATDCDGLLAYVAGVVSACGRSIRRAYTATDPVEMEATLGFEVLVQDVAQLRKIIDKIAECDEVTSVRRIGPNEGLEFFPPQLARVKDAGGEGGRPLMGGEILRESELEIDELNEFDDVE